LLLALIALGVPLAVSLRDRVDSEVRGQARSQADVVAATAAELLSNGQKAGLQKLVRVSARTVRGRVIVVKQRGAVVADSAGRQTLGVDYGSRPEVRFALAGRPEQIQRHSNTLGEEILATAVPIVHGRGTAGAVRITQSVAAVHRAVRREILYLALLGGVVLLLGLAAGALVARGVAMPIRRLDTAARRVAAGDLDARVQVEGSTEQRSLAGTFNEMTTRVKRLLRGQQDFVADASHQLRTPLTGLRLRLEGLRDRYRGDPATARDLDAGMREIDRLSRMVDELLVLSRAGERELPAETVDLEDTARRGVERWRDAAGDRDIDLSLTVEEPAGRTSCASADIDRVIDVLVENAVRYSPPGSTVDVRCLAGRIEVLDEGPGLAPDEPVFDRFYRGSTGRQGPGGTGLGLPIARELAREWGGEVQLENRQGRGARAVVSMPPA
jgi:two-component system, OmpR family, sensor kinase